MSTDLRDKIDLKKLEIAQIEAQTKLEEAKIQKAQLPGKLLWLTVEEWTKLAETGGGCIWSIPVIALIGIVLFDSSKLEAYDQLIANFAGVAIAYYLTRKK